jgi:hypothetical protein
MAAAGDGNTHDELEATLQARRELGPAYDDALVESFIAKIDDQIQARVDARMAERSAKTARTKTQQDTAQRQFALGVISLGTGIPITAIAAGTEGVWGLVTAWLGIAGVNAAHAWSSRRER